MTPIQIVADNDWSIDFLVVAVLLLIFVAQLWMIFFKSYFEKGGENLATKEDIQVITRLAGDVKNDLSVMRESRLSYQELRRDSIVQYYTKLVEWQNYLTRVEFDHVNYKSESIKMAGYGRECDAASSKFSFFVEESEKFNELLLKVWAIAMKLEFEYLFQLGSYESIHPNDVHIRAERIKEFDQFRLERINEWEKPMDELVKKLRALIRENTV